MIFNHAERLFKRTVAGVFFSLVFSGFTSCGSNTEEPVYPMLAFLLHVGAPAITNVTPVEEYDYENLNYRIEFDISYYVTNTENEFLGYNLYISSTASSPEDDNAGQAYLPEGTEPTFPHSQDEASTASEDLVTQRVTHYHPLPNLVPFYTCEKYYFRMKAITRSGVNSNAGPQVEACATVDSSLCPTDSPCYNYTP